MFYKSKTSSSHVNPFFSSLSDPVWSSSAVCKAAVAQLCERVSKPPSYGASVGYLRRALRCLKYSTQLENSQKVLNLQRAAAPFLQKPFMCFLNIKQSSTLFIQDLLSQKYYEQCSVTSRLPVISYWLCFGAKHPQIFNSSELKCSFFLWSSVQLLISHFLIVSLRDVRKFKETKKHFDRVREDLEIAQVKNAQAPRNKPHEVEEASGTLSITRKCFRHLALDYVLQVRHNESSFENKLNVP